VKKGNRKIPCYVGLDSSVFELVQRLAKQEENGELSRMLRKLIYEALKMRGI